MRKRPRGLVLGLGMVCLCFLAGWTLGFDPRIFFGGVELLTGPSSESSTDAQGTRQPAQRSGGSRPTDEIGDFVSRVLGSTEDEWGAIFRASGQQYRQPKLVLYLKETAAACGLAKSARGPFYCAADQRVYLDTSFFSEVDCIQTGDDDCKFPRAYVIAHEIGHHVQNLLGIMSKVERLQAAASSESDSNHLQVLLELQADCFAGIWAYRVKDQVQLSENDIASAFRVIEGLGNDTLQRLILGYVRPDTFTHGSAEQRHRWFNTGLRSGAVASCNTFAAAAP